MECKVCKENKYRMYEFLKHMKGKHEEYNLFQYVERMLDRYGGQGRKTLENMKRGLKGGSLEAARVRKRVSDLEEEKKIS